jgi:hypothetical protein
MKVIDNPSTHERSPTPAPSAPTVRIGQRASDGISNGITTDTKPIPTPKSDDILIDRDAQPFVHRT